MQTITSISTLVIVTLCSAQSASAQDQLPFDQDGWKLGGGAIYEQSILKDGDDLILPLPYIAYDKGRFHAGFDGLAFDLVQSDAFILSTNLTARDSALTADDLEDKYPTIKRDVAIEAGASAELELGLFSLSAEVLHDVSGAHDGTEVALGVSSGTMVNDFIISVGATNTWRSESLNHYLYGVSEKEASGALVAYAPEESWQPSVNLTTGWVLDNKSMLLGSIDYEFLSDEAKDSPFVDEEGSVSASIFYVRSF